MSFDQFMTETVTLIKQNGQEYPNIKASVQSKMIFIEDISLPIEEGDTILNTLPNSLQERYTVIDRGYHDAFGGIKAGYQCKVERQSSIPFKQYSNITHYNLHGNNSRVNVNSTDNSSNTVAVSPSNVFEELRNTISKNVSSNVECSTLIEHIDEMEAAKDTPTFMDRYKSFISSASDHITVISPFIPMLTNFIK